MIWQMRDENAAKELKFSNKKPSQAMFHKQIALILCPIGKHEDKCLGLIFHKRLTNPYCYVE